MICKHCGYEAPAIACDPSEKFEFITAKDFVDEEGNMWLAAVFKCPKCGKEQ